MQIFWSTVFEIFQRHWPAAYLTKGLIDAVLEKAGLQQGYGRTLGKDLEPGWRDNVGVDSLNVRDLQDMDPLERQGAISRPEVPADPALDILVLRLQCQEGHAARRPYMVGR